MAEIYKRIKVNGIELMVIPKPALQSYLKEHASSPSLKKMIHMDYVELIPGYFFSKHELSNKDTLCRIAGMDKTGVWDVAVPQPWLDEPKNKKRWRSGDWAVWFYPRAGKYRMFGSPVWSVDIIKSVKKQITKVLKP